MRGVIVGYRATDDRPERAVLAAVLVRAIQDAQAGDCEAAAWLDDLAPMLGDLLGLELVGWRTAADVGVRVMRHKRRVRGTTCGYAISANG